MIKVSYNIKKYRNQLFEVINHGDTIIELGCHVGTTSRMILDNFEDITLISVDNSPEAIPKMDNLKKEYNIPIVSINDFNTLPYADININDAGPLEFLSLIYHSSIIVSSSFHATAFSVIFRKNFYVYPLKGKDNSSRMTDFLYDLNLIERYKSEHISLDNINYCAVDKLLDKEINSSKLFIEQILS